MRIRVFKLGNSEPQFVDLPSGSTVQNALDELDIPTVGMTVAINGADSTLEAGLEHRNTVTVLSKVAGGLA